MAESKSRGREACASKRHSGRPLFLISSPSKSSSSGGLCHPMLIKVQLNDDQRRSCSVDIPSSRTVVPWTRDTKQLARSLKRSTRRTLRKTRRRQRNWALIIRADREKNVLRRALEGRRRGQTRWPAGAARCARVIEHVGFLGA
ncbi:hypothetical protein MTO96_023291 [Rhipicephalus appendiculatus]